jgi:hypothetical protein
VAWNGFKVHYLVCVLGFVCVGPGMVLGCLPGMYCKVLVCADMALGRMSWYVL